MDIVLNIVNDVENSVMKTELTFSKLGKEIVKGRIM